MSDKNNIVVGSDTVTGGVALAPLGTAEPTDATTALADAFAKTGFVTSDGVEREEKVDTDTIIAWGGNTVRVVKKDITVTVVFAFMEYLNVNVQKAIYGDANVTSTAATKDHGNLLTIDGKVDLAPHKLLVIDMVDGAVRGRLIFHDAQITDRDKYTAKDDDTISRSVTWTLFPDENGSYFKEYWDDGATPAVPAKTVKSVAVAVDGDGDPTVDVGSTIQLKATATYDDDSTEDVTDSAEWASDAEATATVDKGLATGKAAGDANVTAKVGDVTSAKFKLTVSAPAPTLKSIAVAPASGTATSVAVNATLQLKATATYSDNSTKDVSSTAAWASDTTDSATVDNKGLASGKKEGSANITAKVDDVTSPNFKLTVTAAS